MDSYKRAEKKSFKLLPNLGVPMTILRVNRAKYALNSEFSLPSRQS